jgi:hypothetical protein
MVSINIVPIIIRCMRSSDASGAPACRPLGSAFAEAARLTARAAKLFAEAAALVALLGCGDASGPVRCKIGSSHVDTCGEPGLTISWAGGWCNRAGADGGLTDKTDAPCRSGQECLVSPITGTAVAYGTCE